MHVSGMRLTAQTDYGLRIMMFAAARGSGRFTIAEVAAAFGMSRNHAMKIVQKLAAAGMLSSLRGRGGGLTLSKSGEAARLGDLVRLLEDDIAPAICFGEGGHCRVTGFCRLRPALGEAVDAFFAALDRYRLVDIALTPEQAGALSALGRLPTQAGPLSPSA